MYFFRPCQRREKVILSGAAVITVGAPVGAPVIAVGSLGPLVGETDNLRNFSGEFPLQLKDGCSDLAPNEAFLSDGSALSLLLFFLI